MFYIIHEVTALYVNGMRDLGKVLSALMNFPKIIGKEYQKY
jgi:hypothetical protein